MAYYYADSSALVKRHVREAGTDWFRTLAETASGNVFITARLSLIEVYSALNRRTGHARRICQRQIMLKSPPTLPPSAQQNMSWLS